MQKIKLSVVLTLFLLAACSSGSSALYLADADLAMAKQCDEKLLDRDASISGTFEGGKSIFIFPSGVACVTDPTGKLIQTFHFGVDGSKVRATHKYITQSCFAFRSCQRLVKIGEHEAPVNAGTVTVTDG
jgi:hypothetical protein